MQGEPSPQKPLRILHIFRTPVGGLFRHVMDVAQGQIARGHEVGIVCDATTGGAQAEARLREIGPSLGLGLTRIPMSRNPGPADWAGLGAIRKLRHRTSPDIIHGHGAKGGLFARLPAFLETGWPAAVYTPHGGSFHFRGNGPRDRLYRLVERMLARRTGLFLMESAYIAARAEADIGPLRAPVRVVHNGLTRAEFEPVIAESDAADLLYLGEMRVLKGVDTLLLAIARLALEGHRLSVLLVGAGPDTAQFKTMTREFGIESQTVFADPMPIRHALRRARMMVVPSRGESLPYVVLEAAAAAVPLVATDVGGIPEIFGTQKTRLVPPDNVMALAEAIKKAREGAPADTASALATYVRTHFSYDGMVDGGLSAYREALVRSSAASTAG